MRTPEFVITHNEFLRARQAAVTAGANFNLQLQAFEFGLARGKEHHDKRDSIREAESKREIDRVLKARNRSRA